MPDASTILPIVASADRGAAVVAVLRAAADLRRAYEALCQAHGLTLQQFNVLRILRGADRSGEGPLPTMAVGERMVEPEPGVTRLMGRLEAKGLVERARCPSDARCVRCRLTPAGADTLVALDAPVAALDAAAFAGLSSAEVAVLHGLLAQAFPPDSPTSSPSCPA